MAPPNCLRSFARHQANASCRPRLALQNTKSQVVGLLGWCAAAILSTSPLLVDAAERGNPALSAPAESSASAPRLQTLGPTVVPTQAPSAAALGRPRIGLVLSGGGARGLAHIGVLRVLREMRVPVDIVVGTSMGCVIGGAYAAGRSVEELEDIMRGILWESVLADRPERDQLSFRQREEDLILPSRIEFGVGRSGATLPPAAAGNAALELALGRLLPEGTHDRPASQLALPFRSVASDLLSGELVELSDTSLFLAMRASLSLPGVFAPVRIRNRPMVDGGLVRNLPVDVARALGADVIVAVNVGTPLAPESELGSSLGVAQQMLSILTEQNVQRSLAELGPQDILIAPELSGIGFLDFSAQARAVQAGQTAARAQSARLAQWQLSPPNYARHEAQRESGDVAPPATLPLGRVEVHGTEQINPRAIAAQVDLQPGQPVSTMQIREAAAKLYGRGDLGRVETEIKDEDGQRNVALTVNEAAWARSRLRFGIEISSDFSDSNSFTLAAMHVATSLNSWGAELRTTARIGGRRELGSEWWQPLGVASPWYVAPSLSYESTNQDLFQNGLRTARFNVRQTSASVALGRQFGEWGDVRFGYQRSLVRGQLIIPQIEGADLRASSTVQFVRWRLDSLNSLAFPTRGQWLQIDWQRPAGDSQSSPTRSGTLSVPTTAQIIAMAALGPGDWGGHLYGEWGRGQSGSAPQTLGGFLRLSGTEANSISAPTVVFARLVVARRLGSLNAPLGGGVRLGLSLETGGGFDLGETIHWGALRRAASGFFALDTRFGPLYLGAGTTQGGKGSLYVFLGPFW